MSIPEKMFEYSDPVYRVTNLEVSEFYLPYIRHACLFSSQFSTHWDQSMGEKFYFYPYSEDYPPPEERSENEEDGTATWSIDWENMQWQEPSSARKDRMDISVGGELVLSTPTHVGTYGDFDQYDGGPYDLPGENQPIQNVFRLDRDNSFIKYKSDVRAMWAVFVLSVDGETEVFEGYLKGVQVQYGTPPNATYEYPVDGDIREFTWGVSITQQSYVPYPNTAVKSYTWGEGTEFKLVGTGIVYYEWPYQGGGLDWAWNYTFDPDDLVQKYYEDEYSGTQAHWAYFDASHKYVIGVDNGGVWYDTPQPYGLFYPVVVLHDQNVSGTFVKTYLAEGVDTPNLHDFKHLGSKYCFFKTSLDDATPDKETYAFHYGHGPIWKDAPVTENKTDETLPYPTQVGSIVTLDHVQGSGWTEGLVVNAELLIVAINPNNYFENKNYKIEGED